MFDHRVDNAVKKRNGPFAEDPGVADAVIAQIDDRSRGSVVHGNKIIGPDEEVDMMFDLFRGAFVGRSGLLVVTKRRLIFARAFLWTTKVETILWTRVTGVETSEDRRTCDLTIHSEATIWNFWVWGRERKELHFLEDVMKKRLAEASPAPALADVPRQQPEAMTRASVALSSESEP